MSSKIYKIAVIGGGAAGVMAVLRGVLNNDEILFFPGTPKDFKKSRAMWVTKVENIPGFLNFKKGIIDPDNETLKWISESAFSKNLVHKKNIGVTHILKNSDDLFELTDSKGEKYLSEHVVLATGVMDVQPKINGEMKPIFPYANNQSIDYCIRCDGHHVLNKDVALFGFTTSTIMVATMLFERYSPPSMTILLNGEKADFNDEAKALIKKYNFKIISEPITEVLGDTKSGKLFGFKTNTGEEIKSQMCFVSLGMIVYNDLAKSLGASLDERGFVITNPKGESLTVKNLFAAGDLRAGLKKQIYTAWDSAVDSMDEINYKLRVKKRNG